MAKEKKETVKEAVEQPKKEVVENNIDESKFESAGDDSVIKVDLSKPPVKKSEEVEEEPAKEDEVVVVNEEPKTEEVVESVEKAVAEEVPVVQEVTDEEVEEVQEQIQEAITEAEETGNPLPEKLQKVVEFMEETGGDLQDYVNLNRDISKLDDSEVLDEYYRTTKPHLNPEERNFILQERYGYNEDEDDANDIKKKKIALKEQVAEARAHLDGQKSKYYEDIKAGSRLTPEAKKAMDFFNRHNKDQERQKKLTEATTKSFRQKTDSVFNKNFKGFDYQVGDKKFRFNVKDANKVKETQSDLNNFVNKFVGEDKRTISDAAGYHKSLFTAMNADAVAKHFYEQGKADAIKGQVAKDKNINLDPRQTHGETNVGGVTYKVLGNTSDDLKLRIKKRK
tara:strand:+ start:3649 stop:4833 length:1185 start_codon:yes stop_codon:yes gene_type:complete